MMKSGGETEEFTAMRESRATQIWIVATWFALTVVTGYLFFSVVLK